jgi:hypothetical protein
MPDGTLPQPGGWNRFSLEVSDLTSTVEELANAGVHFRNEIVDGVGGQLRSRGATVPERHRRGCWWGADPRRGSVGKPDRTVRAGAA